MGRSRDHANTSQICWISWKYCFQANKLQNGRLKQVPLHLGTTQCQGMCFDELNMDSLHQLGRVLLCRHHGSFRWRAFGVGGIKEERRTSRLTNMAFLGQRRKAASSEWTISRIVPSGQGSTAPEDCGAVVQAPPQEGRALVSAFANVEMWPRRLELPRVILLVIFPLKSCNMVS